MSAADDVAEEDQQRDHVPLVQEAEIVGYGIVQTIDERTGTRGGCEDQRTDTA